MPFSRPFCIVILLLFVCSTPALAANTPFVTGTTGTTMPFLEAGTASDGVASTAFLFRLNGAEMMRLTGTGSLGLGTTSPAQRLDLGGGAIKMGYEAITATCNSTNNCFASCSSGKSVLGGACRRIVNGRYLDEFGPTAAGWMCSWDEAPLTSQATVYCADIK